MNKTINKKLTSSSELTSWPLIDSNFELSRDTSYPKISIVTPSYNQGQFLEKTIRSVLLQSYPNLEYIIMDGGSNDQSVEIIKKYEPWLTHWESKPDKGQTDAINQGMKLATGDIVAYINSDDYYAPNTFHKVAEVYQNGHKWIVGAASYHFTDGRQPFVWMPDSYSSPNHYLPWLGRSGGIAQPSVFWDAGFIKKYGLFKEEMHYCFDTEYWIRLLYNGEKMHFVPQVFSHILYHDQAKTTKDAKIFDQEFETCVYNQYEGKLSLKDQKLIKRAKRQAKSVRLINSFANQISIKKSFHGAFKPFLQGVVNTPIFSANYLVYKLKKKFSL